MRPQLAMAALLVLVLGSSVLLLRARPGAVALTPSKEDHPAAAQAEPAIDAGEVSSPREEPSAHAVARAATTTAAPAAASATAVSSGTADANTDDKALAAADVESTYQRGMSNYRAGNFADARRDLARVRETGGGKAASAALYEARAVRAQSQCSIAIAYYERVRSRFATSAAAADATWEQADCHRQLGQQAAARKLLLALMKDRTYGARAAHELRAEGEAGGSGKQSLAAQRKAARPPQGGSGGQGKARPAPREIDDAAGL